MPFATQRSRVLVDTPCFSAILRHGARCLRFRFVVFRRVSFCLPHLDAEHDGALGARQQAPRAPLLTCAHRGTT